MLSCTFKENELKIVGFNFSIPDYYFFFFFFKCRFSSRCFLYPKGKLYITFTSLMVSYLSKETVICISLPSILRCSATLYKMSCPCIILREKCQHLNLRLECNFHLSLEVIFSITCWSSIITLQKTVQELISSFVS